MEASCLMKFRMLRRYSDAGNDLERSRRARIMGTSPPRGTALTNSNGLGSARPDHWRPWRESGPTAAGAFFCDSLAVTTYLLQGHSTGAYMGSSC
jgi:hypothetical protein